MPRAVISFPSVDGAKVSLLVGFETSKARNARSLVDSLSECSARPTSLPFFHTGEICAGDSALEFGIPAA